jgi:hypothetical protein
METSFLRKIVYRAQNLDGEFGDGRNGWIGEHLPRTNCALHKKFVNFAKLKIFCQKILGILGDFLKWWEKVAIFVLLWNKVGHF